MSAPDFALNKEPVRHRQGADADTVLVDARRLLREAFPEEIMIEATPAVMQLAVDEDEVLAALHVFAQLPLPSSARRPKREPVTVDVESTVLSVAGVVALVQQDGAVRATDHPLHTGRYWCATVRTGGAMAARFWFPERTETIRR